jgi:DNA-binding response OmpR family regulator
MLKRILLVDDEKEIMELLEDFLVVEGYEVYKASNAEQARKVLLQTDIDLLLLDIMMPGESGFSLCKSIRQESTIPILFLTALEKDTDIIRGLHIGADDYIVKSASPGEIVARIKALERRLVLSSSLPNSERENIVRFKNLSINKQTRVVSISGQIVSLTAKEYELLSLLTDHPKQVFTYDQLLESIWGYEFGDAHTVRVYIAKLREKMMNVEHCNVQIVTVWGIGYKLEEAEHA